MSPFTFNVFHILGDVSHTTSKLILIWSIHSNSSAEGTIPCSRAFWFMQIANSLLLGISLITQTLYAAVFLTRYLDIFKASITSDWEHTWNFCLKIFYTVSSLYIILLMTRVYARTREREKAWKFGVYCFLASVIITPFWFLIFKKYMIGTSTILKVNTNFAHGSRLRKNDVNTNFHFPSIDSLDLF